MSIMEELCAQYLVRELNAEGRELRGGRVGGGALICCGYKPGCADLRKRGGGGGGREEEIWERVKMEKERERDIEGERWGG